MGYKWSKKMWTVYVSTNTMDVGCVWLITFLSSNLKYVQQTINSNKLNKKCNDSGLSNNRSNCFELLVSIIIIAINNNNTSY